MYLAGDEQHPVPGLRAELYGEVQVAVRVLERGQGEVGVSGQPGHAPRAHLGIDSVDTCVDVFVDMYRYPICITH